MPKMNLVFEFIFRWNASVMILHEVEWSVLAAPELGLAAHDAHLILQQHIAGDDAEENDALQHAWHARRLDLAAGLDQPAEQDRDQHHGERVQFGEPGDDDAGETVAGRDRTLQAVDDAGNLGHTGQAGQTARKHHHQHSVAHDVDAGVIGRAGVVADQADFIAPPAAIDDEPDDDGSKQPEDDAQVQRQAAEAGTCWA